MKKQLLSLALALSSGFLFSAKGATLIQYNFDSLEDTQFFEDISGNGHRAKFNQPVTVFSNYPFSTSHPELASLDLSGRTRNTVASQGGVENASSINLKTTNQFTMEGWVYVEEFRTKATLWHLSSGTGGTSSFSLGYDTDGTIFGTFNSQSQLGGTLTLTTEFKLELNSWAHLAYVKTANSFQLYLNGTLIGTMTKSGVTSRTLPTELSSIAIAANIYGQFDDFRLSDVALTPGQLGYHTPFSIPEPGVALLLIPALTGLCLMKKRTASHRAA